jgi:prepilin-type processing-associated H-X9-DG protein
MVQWNMIPASYHGGGCCLSFADGHAEFKKWVVPQTRQPVRYWPWDYPEHPELLHAGRQDYEWLARRMYETSMFE